MAHTHFSGPVIVGDDKDSPLRNVGYTLLSQSCALDFTVTTPGAPNYSGGPGQFVTAVANASTPTAAQTNIAYPGNVNATIYTSSSTTYPPTPIASFGDGGYTAYRGCVFYLPINSKIENLFVDHAVQVAGTGYTTFYVYLNNTFSTNLSAAANAIYGYSTPTNGTTLGRAPYNLAGSNSTPGALNYPVPNIQATSADIVQLTQPDQISQVVATVAIIGTNGSGIPTPTAGKIVITIQYIVSDPFLGSTSAYPYDSIV